MNAANAYRYLFPIGCLNAALGAFLWIAFRYEWIEIYPVAQHANLMVGGFLLSYALGFLWTAVPRFLQAPMPDKGELTMLVTCMGLTPALGLLGNPAWFYASTMISLVLTARFARKRFQLRKNDPPSSFIFLGAGILLSILSLLVLILSGWLELPSLLLACAKNFFLKGFFLCLVLGVGIKLVPSLMGWAPLPQPGKSQAEPFQLAPVNFLVLFVLLGGIFLESSGLVQAAGLAYSSALLCAGALRMKLLRLPKSRTALGYFVWISSLIISISPLSLTIDPAFSIHFWHLVFISGFGLLTIFVSMRVVLAHSGQEFARIEKLPVFYLLGGFVLLSSLTRVTAPLLGPQHLLSHYSYAAIVWLVALGIWGFYFFRYTPGLFGKPIAVSPNAAADEC